MHDPQPEGHMASHIGRRKFLATLGAAAWPVAAGARQVAMAVVGLLRDSTAAGSEFMVNGLRTGLAEAGFVEGPCLHLCDIASRGWTSAFGGRAVVQRTAKLNRQICIGRINRPSQEIQA